MKGGLDMAAALASLAAAFIVLGYMKFVSEHTKK